MAKRGIIGAFPHIWGSIVASMTLFWCGFAEINMDDFEFGYLPRIFGYCTMGQILSQLITRAHHYIKRQLSQMHRVPSSDAPR